MERDGLESWFKDCYTEADRDRACELLKERGFTPRVQKIAVTVEERKEEEEKCGLANQKTGCVLN
jgi:hypothetical protein